MAKATFLGTYSTRGIPGNASFNPTDPKIFWFVWEDSIARSFLIQQLDKAFEPCEDPKLLPPKLFRLHFTREPKVTLIPEIAPEVADYLDNVFAPPQKEESLPFFSPKPAAPAAPVAPKEIPSPSQLDKQMRAEFAKAVMKLRKGDKAGASESFRNIAEQKEGIIASHKHMFTDFGTDLRRSKLYDLALTHFSRAVELSPDDSHAYFNVARIFYEMGDIKNALANVNRSLELEPTLKYAQILKQRIISSQQGG